jgi:putative nucleotidyltransferase with HDIG domain
MRAPDKTHRRTVRRGKILYSLVIVMILAGLAPLLVTSTILIERNREALALSEELVQLDQTRTTAKQARLYLQAMHDQVVGIAQTFGIGDSPWVVSARISRVSASDDLIGYIQDGSHVLSITVYDQKGDGAYAGYDLREEVAEYFRQSFLEGISGRHYVSPPHVSETLLDTVVVVSAPIVASGQPAGVVSVLVSLQPIQEMVEAKIGLGREVYVVDGNGRLVVHSNRETLFTQPDFSANVMVRAFQESSGHESRLVNFDLIGESGIEPMVGTYTSIGDRSSQVAFLRTLDWGAIVQAKEEAVYSTVRDIERTSYKVAGFSIILAIVLAVVLAGRLSQPIARLAEGARRLAEGDFSRDIEVTSRNEIGELADTFNLMKAEIKSYIQRLQKAAEENKQMFMGAVSSLAAAIDAKDPYTRGHSERVSNFAERIARELGLPEHDVEVVRISALMHDVGKIGIEDKILGKEGPLTDEEYEIMKTHPTKGAVIMEQVPQLEEMIPGMKYHHENVNGTGYPEGLRGDEIPLTAKIVSVADCFDAMTTNRPYQKAMDISYVLERMRSFVGKKFDRPVVEALIKAYEEGLIRPNMPTRQTVFPAPPPSDAEEEVPAVVASGSSRLNRSGS